MKQLSEYETSLVHDANVLLVKNGILEKVASIFASVSEQYQHILGERQFSLQSNIPPKISRGEKYQGLPYLVLDFPRLFSNEGIMAVRTLFWWGNYFSITLHLQGQYLDQFSNNVCSLLAEGDWQGWQVQFSGDMWQHEINHEYSPADAAGIPPFHDIPFLKLAKKIPLQEWDNIENILVSCFEKLAPVFYAPMR